MSRKSENLFQQIGRAGHFATLKVDRALTNLLHAPRHHSKPGATPGIHPEELAKMSAGDEPVRIQCIDYAPGWAKVQDIGLDQIEAFLAVHRPEGTVVRWINVEGLNLRVIQRIAEKYNLHPLAIEDMLHIPQRPKVDHYPTVGEHHARLFIIAQMISMPKDQVIVEQVSIFLGVGTVLTFQTQSMPGDVWEPIRKRIGQNGSHLRAHDPSYLVYALLDAIVDHCFPILEAYGDKLVDMEEQVMNPQADSREVVQRIHAVKRELLLLRRQVWPMREVVNSLMRGEYENFSDTTRTYMRDVYDHTIQIIELLETYRELASGLAETWMTVVSNRMNEVMKVLTIIATIFIPITFLAGVYGMNFDYLPELHKTWAYPAFWGVCLVVAGTMLVWFRKKRWL